MNALLALLKRGLQSARMHIHNDDRYRFYPVYSALLAAILHSLIYWPISSRYLETLRENVWIIHMSWAFEGAAIWLAIMLGVVGLFRRGWIPKALAFIGVFKAFEIQTWNWGFNGVPWRDLYLDVSWYVFDIPVAWIKDVAGGDAFLETGFYALYALAIYVILRPAVRFGWSHVKRLELWVIDRFPVVQRWAKPVL